MPTHDEVYIPKRKSKVAVYSKLLNNPPIQVFTLVFRITGGSPTTCFLFWSLTCTTPVHTHLPLPHYDSTEWIWIKGALSTIDRDFGFLNRVFQDVTHTHTRLASFDLVHSTLLCKRSRDAVKPVMGEYYKIDRTPIFKAMWREAKECIYIEPDQDSEHKGVYWYHKF
ncbi:hypothetical protein Hanom_Chr06g00496761 [Helianthus anomalus]